MEQLLSSTSLASAPGLFEVLQASTPPTVSYFKSLPTDCKKLWAVYLLVLEKLSCRPKIYIGSGTDAKSGILQVVQHRCTNAPDTLKELWITAMSLYTGGSCA